MSTYAVGSTTTPTLEQELAELHEVGYYPAYCIETCHGVPQCGIERVFVELWEEIYAYFEDEEERENLSLGYARIVDLSCL